MDEKTMVSDALVGVNGELKMFGDMIPQTENKELKQCLKQIRNQCEMSQEKLYQVAREKSYYVPAAKATQQEVDHVKSILTQPKMGLPAWNGESEVRECCRTSGIWIRGHGRVETVRFDRSGRLHDKRPGDRRKGRSSLHDVPERRREVYYYQAHYNKLIFHL